MAYRILEDGEHSNIISESRAYIDNSEVFNTLKEAKNALVRKLLHKLRTIEDTIERVQAIDKADT